MSVMFQLFSEVLWQLHLHPQSDLGSKRPAPCQMGTVKDSLETNQFGTSRSHHC